MRRVGLIAANTWREAARQRVFHAFVFLGLAFVLGARWLRDFNFGAPELKFIADSGLGAIAVFGAALSITLTSTLFFSELENRTAQTLLASPVSRADFIAGKFLGIAGVLAVFCAGLTLLLAASLWSRETEIMRALPEALPRGRPTDYVTLVVAGGLHWLKLIVLAAFVLAIASFAQTPLFTLTTSFLFWFVCQLQHVAREVYLRSGGFFSDAIGGVLQLVPNFQVFAIADAITAGEGPGWSAVARVVIYGVGYSVVAAGAAVWLFRQREL